MHGQDTLVVVKKDLSVTKQHESPREIDLNESRLYLTRNSPELLQLWLSEFSQADLCFQSDGLSSSDTLRPRTSTTLQRAPTEISKEDGALDQTAVRNNWSIVPEELNVTYGDGVFGAYASSRVLTTREDLIGFGAILPFDHSQTAICRSKAEQDIVVGAVLPSDRSKTVITESQAEEGRLTGFEPATLVVHLNGEAKSCRARFDTGSAIHIMAEKVAKRFTGIEEILVGGGGGGGVIMASDYGKVHGHSRHDCTVLGMMKMTFYLDQDGKPRSWPYRDFFYILSDDDVQGNFDVMIRRSS